MGRWVLMCGVLLIATGLAGIFLVQAGIATPAVPETTVAEAVTGPTQPEVHSIKIDRIVVAGVVMPLSTGCLLLVIGALGAAMERSRSWVYVGILCGLPAVLMLVLSFERIPILLSDTIWPEALPVVQLLIGAALSGSLAVALVRYGVGQGIVVRSDIEA